MQFFFVKMVLCVWADKIVLASCKLHSNVMACIDSEVLFVRVCVCVFFFNCASSAIYIFNFHLKQPQTKNGIDTFGGLGATIVDCLDTLFIMGLDEQFQRAREWVYIFFPSLFPLPFLSKCICFIFFYWAVTLLSDFSIWGCILNLNF